MLSRNDCEGFEQLLHAEIAKRQQLGGYNADAGTIAMLCKISFELVRHIKETRREPKAKKDDA